MLCKVAIFAVCSTLKGYMGLCVCIVHECESECERIWQLKLNKKGVKKCDADDG